MTLRLEVPGEHEGSRLDRYLAACLAGGWTRSAARRLILGGCVTVDGVSASKPGLSLQRAMRVEVQLPAVADETLRGENIPLDVLYEDDDILVLNKPAGLLVHPGHGQREGTLVNALLGRGTPLARTGGLERPGIVHRLDQGTSGVLVVAKTDPAHRVLAEAFARREVHKVYLALVWGRVSPATGEVSASIARSRTDRVKMSVSGRGRPALTRYRTLEELPGFSLLEVLPHTGRTHQIRVHLQSIHHPIVGDERYGGRPWRGVQDPLKRRVLQRFDRPALHASRLRFAHPSIGREMEFQAPLPGDLAELLTLLRQP